MSSNFCAFAQSILFPEILINRYVLLHNGLEASLFMQKH
jgi:hypothetical protein